MDTNEAKIKAGNIKDPRRVLKEDLEENYLLSGPIYESVWKGKIEKPFYVLCMGKKWMAIRYIDQKDVTFSHYGDRGLEPYSPGIWNTRYTRLHLTEPEWNDDWF